MPTTHRARGSAVLGCLLALPALLGAAVPDAAPAPASLGAAPSLDYALTPARIAANCAARIGDGRRAIDRIVATPPSGRTFATVVAPLEDASSDLNDRLVAETLLSSVSTSRPVRDASLACQNAVSDFLTAQTARPDLYRAVAAARRGGTARTPADRKLTELWLTALARAGAGLPAAKRAAFVALGQRLSADQNAFGANLGNATATIRVTPAQTAGLPADFVATLARDGDAYVVPVRESTSVPFLSNATDPDVRRAFYVAYNTRAAPRNVELLQRAIATRDRLAHLLGYPTWAAYVLADRMAGTPARVDGFLAKLDGQLLPRARADVARLAALKAADLGTPTARIEPWDVAFYDERLRRTRYAVDADVVRRYFPVDHVERAVFDIYARILGVRFTQRAEPNVWAAGVTQWAVTDAASGAYVGDFYLDLFPREGKYAHFASFPLLPIRRRPDGTVRPALDAIIGNWPQPAPGKPALLSHEDIETFFHEFGHDMATMLATTPYETLSSGFRQDFVEAPSQMLENWVWDPTVLKELSSDVATGEPLPDALIAKMRAARYVDDAYFTTRQILLATVDMAYHTARPPVDTTAVWASVARAETPLPLPDGVRPQASFGHLMGGYDAGYYGYLWSKVYAQDLFTAFERGGLESPEVGARYRRAILAPAREREPDAEVRAFLGRPMDPSAFYAEFAPVGSDAAAPAAGAAEPAASPAAPAPAGSPGSSSAVVR